MLFAVDKEPLAKGACTSSRDRDTDYRIQAISAQIIQEEYEEMDARNKQCKTNQYYKN